MSLARDRSFSAVRPNKKKGRDRTAQRRWRSPGNIETARRMDDAHIYLLFAAAGRIGLGDYDVAAQYLSRHRQNDYTAYASR